MWSSETKLSCIKTELKRCTMTESLWNTCDISRKSPEVPVIIIIIIFNYYFKLYSITTIGGEVQNW